MRVGVGSDHRGVQLKTRILETLEQLGHSTFDAGTHSSESIDYPDVASLIGRKVSTGELDRGILICGTGIGMAITANKFPGVRAAPCNDEVTADLSRRHNDLNVLCLSGDLLGERDIAPLIKLWMETEFEGGRHGRRLHKISEIESALDSKIDCD